MDFIQESLQEEGSEFNFGSTTSPSLKDGGVEAFSVPRGAAAVNRHLTDIKSVIEFYGLPKKQGKPSGKLATTPFEAFDHNIYIGPKHYLMVSDLLQTAYRSGS